MSMKRNREVEVGGTGDEFNGSEVAFEAEIVGGNLILIGGGLFGGL